MKHVIALGLLLHVAPALHAQFKVFLEIPNTPGESTETNHVGWIELESYGFGLANSASPIGGNGGGRMGHSRGLTFLARRLP